MKYNDDLDDIAGVHTYSIVLKNSCILIQSRKIQELQWRHSALVTSDVRMLNNEAIKVVAHLLALILSLLS